MNKSKFFNEFKRYFFMIIGCFLFSSGLTVFLIPNKIITGGMSGVASVINILTGLSTGAFIVILNLPIVFGGLKIMGWRFFVRSLITTVTLGLTTELCGFIPAPTNDPILAVLYGGILQGAGLYLFIKYEMSSGGTELLARITHKFIKVGTIATHLAVLDGIIVVFGAIMMKNANSALYALILIFITAKVNDLLLMGFNKTKMCYIITDNAEEVAENIINGLSRGVTFLDGKGMYTKEHRNLLISCIYQKQITGLKTLVKEIDPNAFVIVCDANEVYGKGFHSI